MATPDPIYKINNQEVSASQIRNAANQQGITFDEYVSEYNAVLVPGKTADSTTTDPNVESENTGSNSGDGFLGSVKLSDAYVTIDDLRGNEEKTRGRLARKMALVGLSAKESNTFEDLDAITLSKGPDTTADDVGTWNIGTRIADSIGETIFTPFLDTTFAVGDDVSDERLAEQVIAINKYIDENGDVDYAKKADKRSGALYKDDYLPYVTAPDLTKEELSDQFTKSKIDLFKAVEKENTTTVYNTRGGQSFMSPIGLDDFNGNEKEFQAYQAWKSGNPMPAATPEEITLYDAQRKNDYAKAKSQEFASDLDIQERFDILALARNDVNDIKNFSEQRDQLDKKVNLLNNTISDYELAPTIEGYTVASNLQTEVLNEQTRLQNIQNKARESGLLERADSAPLAIQDFDKNYDRLSQLGTAFKSTAGTLAYGVAVLEYMRNPMNMSVLASSAAMNASIERTTGLVSFAGDMRDETASYQDSLTVGEINSMKDAGRWVASTSVNLVPSLAMAATGPAALPMFFLSGFGGATQELALNQKDAAERMVLNKKVLDENLNLDAATRNQLSIEMDEDSKTLNISNWRNLGNATLHGIAEVALEKVGTLALFKSIKAGVKGIPINSIKEGFEFAGKEVAKGFYKEGGSEFATTLIQNFGNIYILDEDKNFFESITSEALFEGGAESFFGGALMGSNMASINAVKGVKAGVASELATKEQKQNMEVLITKLQKLTGVDGIQNVEDIERMNLDLDPNVQKMVDEITNEGFNIQEEILKGIQGNLSKEQLLSIGEINRKQRNLNKQLIGAVRNSKIGASALAAYEAELREQFDKLEAEKSNILNNNSQIKQNQATATSNAAAWNSKQGYAEYANVMLNESVQNIQEAYFNQSDVDIQKGYDKARAELEAEGGEFTDDDIKVKAGNDFVNNAYKLKIDKGEANAKKFAEDMGMNLNFQTFEGKDRAAGIVSAWENSGPHINENGEIMSEKEFQAAKAELIKAIENGSFEAMEINGNVIVDKTASIKNKRIGVYAHEVLHAFARKTIGKDSDINARGQELLDYLEKNQPDLHAKVMFRIKGYEGRSEYLEEAMNAMSDILADGFQVNEGVKNQFRNFYNAIVSKLPGGSSWKLSEKENEGAYQFVKNFNSQAHFGKESAVAQQDLSNNTSQAKAKKSTTVKDLKQELDILEDSEFEMDPDDFDAQKANLELKIRQALKKEKGKPKNTQSDTGFDVSETSTIAKINNLVPKEIKTAEEYKRDRRVQLAIDKAFKANGIISNIVKGRFGAGELGRATLKSVKERALKYNPAAKRKKAGNNQPVTFAEFIFSNVNFGKLDAAKKLAIEAADKKNKTDLDNKEAQSKIAEDDTVKKDRPKFRKLIDSNVLPGFTIKEIGGKLTKVLKVLKSKLDAKVSINRSVSPVIAEIKKAMGKQADIDLKEAMGGKKDGKLQKWLLKNKKAVLENMTTTWLMGAIPKAIQKSVGGSYKVDSNGTRVKDSYGDFIFVPNFTSDWQGKNIDREKTSTNKSGKTAGGDIVRRLPNIANALSDADFVGSVLQDVSIDADGKMTSGAPIRGKKESMAKAIAEEISLEIFNKELQDENSEISKAFENNQAALGVVLGDAFLEDVARQSERGAVKFSKTKLQDMFYTSIEGDAAAVDGLYATLDEESKAIWEKVGAQLSGGSEGYKKGLKVWKDAPNAIKGILADYFENNSKRDNKIAMKQLDDFSNKLIDALPNSLVKSLGFDFFGAHFRYLNTKEGTKGGDIKNKINNLKVDGIDLGFDPNNITIVQAGFGLVDKITKDVLNKEFNTVQDKIDYFNKNYKDKVDSLNIANKQAAQIVLETAFDIIAKNPKQAVGFLRLLESTTNIGKSLRALTGISDIQFHAESQAVYLNKDTGDTYTNTLTKPQQKLAKEGVIVINENHPNYKDAVKAIKDGSKQSLAQLLRIKGEHATPDAKKKLGIAKILLDHIAIAIENPTQVKLIKNAFAAKLKLELQDFNQQLNTKVLSDIQDSKLGATSDIGDARLVVIPKESLLAFYDIEGLQTVGRVKRAFNDMFTTEKTKELATVETQQKAVNNARSIKWSQSPKKIRVFDFDDTLARTKSNVLYTMPDGTTGKIDAATFAKEAGKMEADGAQWDFSEFSKVMNGQAGPLLGVAKIIADKRGTKDVFVLTARPADSAGPIQEFLSSMGLNIPLENITGLGNGTPKAKADWIIDKVAEGYNDFYFADDHTGNVKAVKNALDTFDVKGKVQLAKVKFSKSLDTKFNDMIERQKGVESFKEFSKATAQRRGKTKGKFKYFISPSAEDMRGLTQYVFAGKGKQGELDQKFFEESLMDPYFQGVAAIESARQTIKDDAKALLKTFKPVRKKLNKLIKGEQYTYDAAVRVYLWNKAGEEVPGLSKRDNKKLNDIVANDPELSSFADGLLAVSKKDSWPAPSEYWLAQTTLSDLDNLTEKTNRKEFLSEFIENVDIIFSEKNLNKVEALYGEATRKAIENAIYAMKTGSNSPNQGGDAITSRWMNWVNSSIGTIMFFNRRSAVLQTLSAANFINWSDNNPLQAALAFANQPQYWKDFAMLFNSDKLKQRRGGLKSDVQESEIANAAKNSKDKAQAVISYILKIGFTPTQLADSFAISMGGASFYRNRVKTYLKEGLSKKEAEQKAFSDFSKSSDEAQQSGDPALVSQQQRSVAGRLILSFQNTTMQYTRLMKKAGQDLINGRGDAKQHISKILYYGAIQNFLFNALSKTAFALIPGFDEEDEEDEDKKNASIEKKATSILDGMIDSVIRGTGIYGAIFTTLKNTTKVYIKEDAKGFTGDQAKTILELANLSPAIGSKLRKVYSAIQTKMFDKDIIAKHPWSVTIDGKFNPSSTYSILANLGSAAVNIPFDRMLAEARSVAEMLDNRNTIAQRVALALGWRTWNVGAKNEEFDLIKLEGKAKRKEAGKEKAKKTREAKKQKEKERVANLTPAQREAEARKKAKIKKEKARAKKEAKLQAQYERKQALIKKLKKKNSTKK